MQISKSEGRSTCKRWGWGLCEWWGHPHAGVTVERLDDAVSCDSLDRTGNQTVPVFGYKPGHTWADFEPRCKHPLPQYYLAHERPGSPKCDVPTSR